MAERNMFKATLQFKKRLSSENYLMLNKGHTGEWSDNKPIIFQLFFQTPQTIFILVCDFIYFPPCWLFFPSHLYLQGQGLFIKRQCSGLIQKLNLGNIFTNICLLQK